VGHRRTESTVLPVNGLAVLRGYRCDTPSPAPDLPQHNRPDVYTHGDVLPNPAERAHRGIAIGRKNWLHVGSERGGHAAAIHFSLIASCKMNGIAPFAYLVDILPGLPSTPDPELGHLAPTLEPPATAASI
jgi:hypothetical protein